MHRFLALALSILLVSASESAVPQGVAGLWIWHQPWTSAPKEIVEDSGPSWYASGLLLNLCEDGRLRLATGVLYRGTGSVSLGVSDGLSLYEGEWAVEGESIKISYRLVDSEVRFTRMELAKRTQLIEHLRIEGGELLFSFRRAGEATAPSLRLIADADATPKVEDRFVKCKASESNEPSDTSLERMRE